VDRRGGTRGRRRRQRPWPAPASTELLGSVQGSPILRRPGGKLRCHPDPQDSLTSIERCRKPVLAAIHGHCLGGGVDLICACDMRYCSSDASFSIKEIDVGMTADVGTLQRLPKLIGEGMVRELAYTGRAVTGAEAKEIGLVNHSYASAACSSTRGKSPPPSRRNRRSDPSRRW
jgi:hypothetical protein